MERCETTSSMFSLPVEATGGEVRLKRRLYGMRPAASAWEEHAEKLQQNGYERGFAVPEHDEGGAAAGVGRRLCIPRPLQ